jgi:hypothetical protein
VIRRFKDEILPIPIGEPFPQIDDGFFEFLWHQDFMRERGKGEIKVVAEFGLGQVFGLHRTVGINYERRV